MKLHTASLVFTTLGLVAAMTWVAGVAAAQEAAKTADRVPPGQYKIAVVNRKKVFDNYTKKQKEWAALELKRQEAEKELNDRLNALQAERKKFEANRDKMTDAERTQKENDLNTKLRALQADGDNEQNEINQEGAAIIKQVTGEINAAIQTIGKRDHYHLILESDRAISSVVYYAESLDITPEVLEYVNSHADLKSNDAPPAVSHPKHTSRRRRRR